MRERVVGGTLALLMLSGCGGYYGGVGYGGGYAYDGFYDNYYGPIYDGYWGRGEVFYYRGVDHGRYLRDRSGHFRRGPGAPGFAPMHGMGPRGFHGGGPPPGPHGPGGRRR